MENIHKLVLYINKESFINKDNISTVIFGITDYINNEYRPSFDDNQETQNKKDNYISTLNSLKYNYENHFDFIDTLSSYDNSLYIIQSYCEYTTDKSSYAYRNEREYINCNFLDNILEVLIPEVTYLQYKKLISKLENNKIEYTQHGYYGEKCDYIFYKINLYDFINLLKDTNKLVDNSIVENQLSLFEEKYSSNNIKSSIRKMK